jgi:hypothetical protein
MSDSGYGDGDNFMTASLMNKWKSPTAATAMLRDSGVARFRRDAESSPDRPRSLADLNSRHRLHAVVERGLLGSLLRWFQRSSSAVPRLALLERISLGPRQALSLVEVDGIRLLVASSPDSGVTFLELGRSGDAASFADRTRRVGVGSGTRLPEKLSAPSLAGRRT